MRVRAPSVDQGVPGFNWSLVFFLFMWLGGLAVGVSGGLAFVVSLVAAAADVDIRPPSLLTLTPSLGGVQLQGEARFVAPGRDEAPCEVHPERLLRDARAQVPSERHRPPGVSRPLLCASTQLERTFVTRRRSWNGHWHVRNLLRSLAGVNGSDQGGWPCSRCKRGLGRTSCLLSTRSGSHVVPGEALAPLQELELDHERRRPRLRRVLDELDLRAAVPPVARTSSRTMTRAPRRGLRCT